MTKKILIATVNSAFGIKGEVKAIIYSDEPQNIENYQLFDKNGQILKVKIRNSAITKTNQGCLVTLKIDGINDRNSAEMARNMEIFANREDFAATSDDEFYYSDLIGLAVIDENKNKLGTITNVDDYGAGGIIEITFASKNDSKPQIENFPFKNEIFPEVNVKEGFAVFVMPEFAEIK